MIILIMIDVKHEHLPKLAVVDMVDDVVAYETCLLWTLPVLAVLLRHARAVQIHA